MGERVSVEAVEEYFRQKRTQARILIFQDTSTVAKAAESLGVEPGEIAKSLLFQTSEGLIMILMAGDKRLDNRKYKAYFRTKAKMLDPRLVEEVTGHEVGGVCPFGLRTPLPVYLDKSLQGYTKVYPAAGAANAAVELPVAELAALTGGSWIDVAS